MSRLPQPINAESSRRRLWTPYQKRERLEVLRRCKAMCEACGKRTHKLEGAHIFARRQIVGEPWASSRYLVLALCHIDIYTDALGCHEKIDRHIDDPLRDRLEEMCARDLYAAFGLEYPTELAPDGAIRQLAGSADREMMIQVLHLNPAIDPIS